MSIMLTAVVHMANKLPVAFWPNGFGFARWLHRGRICSSLYCIMSSRRHTSTPRSSSWTAGMFLNVDNTTSICDNIDGDESENAVRFWR